MGTASVSKTVKKLRELGASLLGVWREEVPQKETSRRRESTITHHRQAMKRKSPSPPSPIPPTSSLVLNLRKRRVFPSKLDGDLGLLGNLDDLGQLADETGGLLQVGHWKDLHPG